MEEGLWVFDRHAKINFTYIISREFAHIVGASRTDAEQERGKKKKKMIEMIKIMNQIYFETYFISYMIQHH